MDLTWLKEAQLGPCKAEVKHNRSPNQQKLLQWKLNAKKPQHSGSDKKPSMLETATAKIDMAESSVAQSQIPEELWLG